MAENELLKQTGFPDLDQPPRRVVSIVPSITESLFDLGFGESVVGITDYCIHPKEKVHGLPKVGGPKNPNIEKIEALNPDFVFANQEENSQQAIKSILNLGVGVWLSFPQNVDESLDVLRTMLAIYHTDKPALKIVTLQNAVDYARAAAEDSPKVKFYCPIWKDALGDVQWWMTFNKNTYSHDLLALLGGENIFADRKRLYPLKADLGIEPQEDQEGADTRYPRVTSDEINELAPEVILLPDDPFNFNEQHKQDILTELRDTPAVKNKRIHFLDGSLITWPGTRLGKALQELPQYL